MSRSGFNQTSSAITEEEVDIDLIDEFDFDESNDIDQGESSVVVAEEFDNLITEFDNAEIVEDITVMTTAPTFIPAVYSTSVSSPSIPVVEMAYTYDDTTYDDDDEMLVEAIQIISCENPQENLTSYNSDGEYQGSQFVEYSAQPFESKLANADVPSLHSKMDTFMSDNNLGGTTEYMDDDDIEVFASMMQAVEQEHMDTISDQVENKFIMQAMVASNQQHVQEVNALQQQQEDIAVQIGPICTAPLQTDGDIPQFSVGTSEDSNSSSSSKKKSNSKKKKEKKPTGFAPETNEDYENQKNVLRQEATAKRKRTAGKFAKRQIEWVSITEAMENNQNDMNNSNS